LACTSVYTDLRYGGAGPSGLALTRGGQRQALDHCELDQNAEYLLRSLGLAVHAVARRLPNSEGLYIAPASLLFSGHGTPPPASG
jgi:hypothetical protein